jgi:hypothetical protein
MTAALDPAPPPTLPSKRKLAQTTTIAVAVAAVILVTLVLPAEYGLDPLGTGRALGLTRISAPPPAVEEPAAPSGGQALAPVPNGPIGLYPAEYKVDSAQFVLGPYEFVEYKYHLEQGATMLFAWKSTATVLHDFHGERDSARGEAVSFEKKERRQGTATFTAPFTGIHGWYWENPGGDTVTVTVKSAGFYTSALEFRSDRTRRPHDLTPLDNPAAK